MTRWEIDRLLSRLPLEDTERATIDRLLEGAASRFDMPPKGDRPVSLTTLARDLYKVSGIFDGLIGSPIASNPVLNMLLDLIIAREGGSQVSVTSLCIASREPTTSALRHIARMEQQGLVIREADEGDHRRSWVSLTDRAAAIMHGLLADVYAAGTPDAARRAMLKRRGD
jgi:hypothetical protein